MSAISSILRTPGQKVYYLFKIKCCQATKNKAWQHCRKLSEQNNIKLKIIFVLFCLNLFKFVFLGLHRKSCHYLLNILKNIQHEKLQHLWMLFNNFPTDFDARGTNSHVGKKLGLILYNVFLSSLFISFVIQIAHILWQSGICVFNFLQLSINSEVQLNKTICLKLN
jgi:hypothetical protein